MRTNPILVTVAAVALLAGAAAHAQNAKGDAGGSAAGQAPANAGAMQGTAETDASKPAATQAAGETQANAGSSVDVTELKKQVTERSDKVSAKEITSAEGRLDADVKSVDADAAEHGDATVAARLAQRFGVTADALTSERQQTGASWGQLMIAHTLVANAKSGVTVEQLLALKNDGMGWGRIAAGLGFELGSAMKAVDSESKVALGKGSASGHVAVIRGEGARAGLGGSAGMHAGVKGVGAKVGAGAAVGVKTGH